MTRKDRVVQATDKIAEALRALVRIDYDNPRQAMRNIEAAAIRLVEASETLLAK